jgi:hypothetical protein
VEKMKRYQVIIGCRNRQYFYDFNEAVEATKKAIEAGEATITLYGRGGIFYYRKRQGVVLNNLIN